MTTFSTKFKNRYNLNTMLESTQEPKSTKSGQSSSIKILDIDYKPTNLDEIVGNGNDLNEGENLRVLINKYKELCNGTLGYFNIPPIKLEKKIVAEPVHSKSLPLTHIHRDFLYKEIQSMEVLGIIHKALYFQ